MGKSGVGMPEALALQEFGEVVWAAFGDIPFQVGSSLETTTFRDVDVRLLLEDAEYARQGFGEPGREHHNAKWRAMVAAFSALGRQMTGLRIDFQIQQRTYANETYPNPRSALFNVARAVAAASTPAEA